MMTRFPLFAAVVVYASLSAHADSIEKEDSTCAQDVHGSCVPSASASLLQKVFHRDAKSTLTQEPISTQPWGATDASEHDVSRRPVQNWEAKEDNLYDTVCTGTQAQGRCWFLSEMGESCAATCKLHGRSFSYAIADPDSPVTPALVGHEPKVKQQPWAALECYVPSEDRFHTANQNAARHYISDVGTWSHENCKLACPCGGAESDRCSWTAPPTCTAEFMWKGVKYEGCATVDLEHERPWCQHNFQHTDKENGNYAADWSYCTYDCIAEQTAPPKEDDCGWTPAFSCLEEFDYEGTHYVGCTGTDHDTPWCSNTDPYQGSWNHCSYTCKEERKDPVVPVPVPSDEQLCTWQAKPECAKTFEYKGVEYTGCIEQDHPTPWCSLDRIHKGVWEKCTRVCSSASGPVAPVPDPPAPPVPRPPYPVPDTRPAPYPVPDTRPAYPVPRTPTKFGDACDRHPDAENDIIGNSVTLDEAGYKIAAAAESPLNMKRFICRIVGSIGCRVVDLSALMAFVPYYSGHVSHQSHKHLESELTTLCHTGGKWVVPRPLP